MNKQCQITAWQWFRLPALERSRRVTEFRAADAALQAHQPPDNEEDEMYLLFNGRVNDLWPTVPWWWRL
jgi:hypothetical protein